MKLVSLLIELYLSLRRPQFLTVSGRSKTVDHESDFGDGGGGSVGGGCSRGEQMIQLVYPHPVRQKKELTSASAKD